MTVTRFALVAFIAYGFVVVLALVVADRVMFQPPPSSYRGWAQRFERVEVGAGEHIALVHLPNPAARFTILYSHGNAEDLGHVLPVLEALHDRGFAVVGYDYRGYGESSPGPATAEKAMEDAAAAYRHVVENIGVGPERLIVYGFSVGSGPAVALAATHRLAGLVVQSGFTSAARVMTRVPLLPFDRFSNLRSLRDVGCPVLVIHGTQDLIVPWSHGRSLYARAAEPKLALWVEGAGHNDVLWVAEDRWHDALERFVGLIEGSPGV